ncbi:MAG: spermidine synthase, partial [Candidatus Aenigmatarchaeota archaeon]
MIFSVEFSRNLVLNFQGELIFEKRSKYQLIRIIRTREFGKMLLLDNNFQLSEYDEHIYHEAFVHPAFCCRDADEVLILGGGDGGVAREVLKWPVKKVEVYEMDPEVVEVVKGYMPEVPDGAFEDPRLKVRYGDARELLERQKKKWDIIICDLTDPEGPSARLFTKEFYQLCKDRLKPDGILVINADSPAYLEKPPDGLFGFLATTVKSVFPWILPYLQFVPSFFAEQGFALASRKRQEPDPKRLRGLKLGFLDENRLLSYFKPNRYIQQILRKRWKISTDR